MRWWCWPPALPRPAGCFRCLPIRPWPMHSCPRFLRVLWRAVGCSNIIDRSAAATLAKRVWSAGAAAKAAPGCWHQRDRSCAIARAQCRELVPARVLSPGSEHRLHRTEDVSRARASEHMDGGWGGGRGKQRDRVFVCDATSVHGLPGCGGGWRCGPSCYAPRRPGTAAGRATVPAVARPDLGVERPPKSEKIALIPVCDATHNFDPKRRTIAFCVFASRSSSFRRYHV